MGAAWDPAALRVGGAGRGPSARAGAAPRRSQKPRRRPAPGPTRKRRRCRPSPTRLLRNPPAADWLNWRRTLDGQGYSPLDQIDRGNVKNLRLAWALTMHEGSNQPTPLIHDGVMFLTHPGNVIQALDAANGDLIWEYAYEYPPESQTLGGPTRNIAIYGDKLYLATYDAAIVAIDARTGQQVWRTVKADYAKGYTHTAGPVIADGVVDQRHQRLRALQEGRLLHHGSRPGDRPRAVAHVDDRAAPRSERRDLGQACRRSCAAEPTTGSRAATTRELKLYYLGTSQAEAVGGRQPRHVAARRSALHELDARARSAHRQDPLVLPAHARRDARHGERSSSACSSTSTASSYSTRSARTASSGSSIAARASSSTSPRRCTRTCSSRSITGRARLEYRDDIVDAKIGDPVSVCPSIYGGHNWQATAYSPQTQR